MQKKREKKISTCYFNNMQIFYEYVLPVLLRYFNFLKYIYEKIKVLSRVYFETLSEFIFLLNYRIII